MDFTHDEIQQTITDLRARLAEAERERDEAHESIRKHCRDCIMVNGGCLNMRCNLKRFYRGEKPKTPTPKGATMSEPKLYICDHAGECGSQNSEQGCDHAERHELNNVPVPWCEPGYCSRVCAIVRCIPVEEEEE
jgi:hypothetical protein